MSDERGTEEARRKAEADIKEGKERARQAAGDAKAEAEARIEAGSEQAAEQVDDIADAVSSAASRLSEADHEGLADYAGQLAGWLSDASRTIREKNVDELTADVRNIARRNPALFVLGSVAVGLGLSRFAKASRQAAGDGQQRSAGDDLAWRQSGDLSGDRTRLDTDATDRQMTPDATGGTGL